MSVKITIPNTSSDYLTFGSANTPDAAKIGGYEDSTGNGHLELYTTASGTSTERMRIDANGNVGIGTSSPSTYGKLAVSGVLGISNVGASGYVWRYFRNTSTATAYCYDDGTNVSLTVQTAGALQFGTNDTERMRIDSSGNVLVGTTSAATLVGVIPSFQAYTASAAFKFTAGFNNASTNDPGGIVISYTGMTKNTAGSEFIYCNDTTALRMSVRSNGGIANYQANNANLSDERTKTDIVDAGNYLDKICAIPVRTFKYKDQTDNLLNLGVIAQEVEKVAPELVDISGFGETPEDGIPLKAIYQTDLQYALMKCIQELKAELDTVKSELATLKGTV